MGSSKHSRYYRRNAARMNYERSTRRLRARIVEKRAKVVELTAELVHLTKGAV